MRRSGMTKIEATRKPSASTIEAHASFCSIRTADCASASCFESTSTKFTFSLSAGTLDAMSRPNCWSTRSRTSFTTPPSFRTTLPFSVEMMSPLRPVNAATRPSWPTLLASTHAFAN